jgi:transposase
MEAFFRGSQTINFVTCGFKRSYSQAGRKKDFRDAERLVKRLVAHELVLSFVPDVEQRLWRTIVRTKYQLTRNRVQLQN